MGTNRHSNGNGKLLFAIPADSKPVESLGLIAHKR